MYQQHVRYFANVISILIVSLSLPGAKCNVGSNPWQAIEISPAALHQIDYGSRRIEIREHLRNYDQSNNRPKTYFVSPLCELDPFSAVRKWNNITQEFEVRFTVQMWDDKLIQTAREYLKSQEDLNLSRSRVQLLPIQSVALRCSGCKGFGINGSPLRVTALPKRVHFSLTCETAEEGDRLVALMKSDPEYFQILRLAFALQGQPLETKVMAVQLDSTLDGDLYTQIKRHLPGKTTAFLLPADEERLKRQFFQDLHAAYFWESSEIQDNYAQQLKIGIHYFLVDSRHDSSRLSPSSWPFLFWQNKDGLMRPDLLAEKLTKVCKNCNASLVQNWFQDTPSNTNSTEEAQQEAEKEIKKSFKVKNVTEFLAKTREFVRWNGTHFVARSLQLTKIYLHERIDARNNGSFQVTVQSSPAALFRDMAIRVEDTPQEQTAITKKLNAILEFLETNITKEIDELKVRFERQDLKQSFVAVENRKIARNLSDSERNNATIASVARNTQALEYLTGLVAHFHRRNRTSADPLWYSSIRKSSDDLIDNLSDYGLVTYWPPDESLWVVSFGENHMNFSSRNFRNKSLGYKQTILKQPALKHNITSVVLDPINSEFLYFEGSELQAVKSTTEKRHYGHNRRGPDRTISTPISPPWRYVLDMSFDWITRNLFILSSNNYFIYVLYVEEPYSWTQLKCSHKDDVIERLLVDPLGGYLFWSTKSSLIRRSWFNGENVTTILDPEGSYGISHWSLTIDHENGTLYFVDSSEKNIVALDRDGNVLKTVKLKWANGEEANLFEKSKNLNTIPGGLVVMSSNQVYFLDLSTEIVHPVDDVPVESASRYVVFSPSLLSSYPRTENPCKRTTSTDCSHYPDRDYRYHQQNCRILKTPCEDQVCLHNPQGEHTCY